MKTRDKLFEAISDYIKEAEGMPITIKPERSEVERIGAGVLALIWVELYRKPYEPLSIGYYKDEKKWYQFWK